MTSSKIFSNTSIIRASYANDSDVTLAQFRIETNDIDVSKVAPGDIILRNLYLSLDPYVRFTLNETGGDTPASWRLLNVPFYGLGISEIIASGEAVATKYPVGALVSGNVGYEQYTRISGLDDPKTQTDLRILPAHARDETKGVPLSYYISALGMPGLTAYAGLKVLDVKPGKIIFVGSAAGGVGQLVGQLAKQQGLRVIGSAGSDEKAAYLIEKQQFDGAFNYKTEDAREALTRLAPNGIDYFYDTVGGAILDLVLEIINEHGKILSIGMISQENGKEPYPIRNLNAIARKAVTIYGFIYWHHLQYFQNGELDTTIRSLLEQGKINYREEVFNGIETAPQHFINMLSGKYAGKVIIKIADL
ncbi:hypothetical protein BX616_004964 [Lobosporangium transversale]|uniref:Enoyl reductase (ER) domain-containing protein n=1 Tax=Lobosporangium transversale TaxID=64571 RepID=A0A1Y2GKJ4_9FUNG|nr:hypothetical protein BCR41DRAFT_325042 [Lobosporangium transversale]KAF9915957.1 hypothetical protein BX616_004964 [Lobosporangium transversale]ORZ10285.1 hypothetical protein BCR41DRAFT_325042 [Lobosporangium transversale]|eukprot:XP_021879192.1 hypothetical protein BCR41DRAFT_325042 [Lobosporangium transversale]